MTQLGWRQLPDGSWLNDFTGDLKGFDEARESQGRRMAERAGLRRPQTAGPHPPTPTQRMVQLPQVAPGQAPREIIDPQVNLALNPYELGLGDDPAAATPAPAPVVPGMSDTMKRVLLMVGIVGAAWGAVRLQEKFKAGPKKHHKKH